MNNKSKNNRKQKSSASIILLSSLAYLVLGFIMIIFPDRISTTLCYALGIVLTVYGLFNVVSFFINPQNNMYLELVVGIVSAGFGVFTLFSPDIIKNIIHVILGIVIVIDSVMDIKHGFQLKALGFGKWWLTVIVSLSVILISLYIIFFPNTFDGILIILLGIIMIYEGISGLVIAGFFGYYSSKQVKGTEIIEVDAEDIY